MDLDKYEALLLKLEAASDIHNVNISDAVRRISEELTQIKSAGDKLVSENKVLRIGVVGQVKAGKSSFLNSLFFDGENVLPRASTPMTAGLTVLTYGETNQFEVEYYNTQEWEYFVDKDKEYKNLLDNFRLENPSASDQEIIRMYNLDESLIAAHDLVSSCSMQARMSVSEKAKTETRNFTNVDELQKILENYVGAKGQFTPVVKCLTIRLNDERLKDLQIVDTPGVNDPVVSREYRTREFLRTCHGVFFLSSSSRFFDSVDTSFMVDRIGSQGIGEIVLIASKFDSALQDVGKDFENDLVGASDDCKKNLYGQYIRNIKASNYSGKDPSFTCSCGIGYSIYKKDKSELDPMEQTVVSQMKRFYPDYFANDDDVKETFYNLSNIDEIRRDYLDGNFVKKKDEIIEEKTHDYFLKSSQTLKSLFGKEIASLENKRDVLNGSDYTALKEKKSQLESVIKKMLSKLESILRNVDESAQRCEKEVKNACAPRISAASYIKPTSGPFERLSTVRKVRKQFGCNVSYISDTYSLIRGIEAAYDSFSRSLSEAWAGKVDDMVQGIKSQILEVIAKAEKDDKTLNLDADILRDCLSSVLSEMKNIGVLDVSNIANLKGNINAAFQDAVFDSIYKVKPQKENEAMESVRKAANVSNERHTNRTNQLVSSISEERNRLLKDAKNKLISSITQFKKNFIDNMNSNVEEYLSRLSVELKNKEVELESYTSAITKLKEIREML